MARPRLRERDELRTALVEQAERLVSAEGADALTARRLADSVGVAVGTTYNVFANQDELVAALNGRTLDRLAEELNSAPLPEGDLDERLIEIARRYISFVEAHSALWLLMFQHDFEQLAQVGVPPTENAQRIERLFGFIEQVLGDLFQPGEERERARTARVLWAGVHGICHLALTGRLAFMQIDNAISLATTLIRCHIAGVKAGCRG